MPYSITTCGKDLLTDKKGKRSSCHDKKDGTSINKFAMKSLFHSACWHTLKKKCQNNACEKTVSKDDSQL